MGTDVDGEDSMKALAAENARLRQLVGELLLKNQRLREGEVSMQCLPEVRVGR